MKRNIYYEDVLTRIGEIELCGEPWEFDILAVWVDPDTGEFYSAQSSGCSCPTPFEEYSTVTDLKNLGTNPHKVREHILQARSKYDDPQELISKVMNWKKEQ